MVFTEIKKKMKKECIHIHVYVREIKLLNEKQKTKPVRKFAQRDFDV